MSLQNSIRTLFVEVFEGTAPGADGTWFVQGGEAIEDTIASLNEKEASEQPHAGLSSIASHVIHMTHYLQLTNAQARGQQFDSDWEGSWKTQAVTAEEWKGVKCALLAQKDLLLELINQPSIVEVDEAVFGAIANIAHAAFHLGAIRQLSQIVKAQAP